MKANRVTYRSVGVVSRRSIGNTGHHVAVSNGSGEGRGQ